MSKGIYKIPAPSNEPVLSYAPGSPERKALKAALEEARSRELDIPMYIGSEEVRTGEKHALTPPHDHQHILGYYHEGDKGHVEQAINAALGAKTAWAEMAAEHRARSEEHTSELQSRENLVCRLLLEKKKNSEDRVRRVTGCNRQKSTLVPLDGLTILV